MRRTPSLLVALLLAAPAASADYQYKHNKKKQPDTALGRLMGRISKFLSADDVQSSHVTAIAAVRGGIPKDQGEDLDQRLLDRALLLRQRLLAAEPSADDAASLRQIYSALGASQWVQSIELDASNADAKPMLKEWAKAKRNPAPPKTLAALLSSGDGIDDKSLIAKGWGSYCRGLTPALSGAEKPVPADRIADSETAGLDEALKGLQSAWLEKKLSPENEAQAHFLAGSVYAQLAAAPLKSVGLPPAKVLAADKEGAPKEVAAISDSGPSDFNPRLLYGKAAKAVVLIMCAAEDGNGELGSGSFIDRSGKILTNAHVVIRGSTGEAWPTIRVYLKPAHMTGDNKQDLKDPLTAKVLAFDRGLDLALIKLDSLPPAFSTLSLGDPEAVSIGDPVAAIGHPEQGGLWTLTTGVVSTVVADLGGVSGKNAFQTDASINRGNSGGPLLNASGEIVGVNTLMSRKAADGLAITAVNFAIKADVARKWLADGARTEIAMKPGPQVEAGAAKAPPKVAKQMVSESKPFKAGKLIEDEIKEMESLEDEMHQEVLKHMDDGEESK